MKVLTPRQVEVLEAIQRLTDDEGAPPSYRRLGLELGVRSTHAVRGHLDALERKGLLLRPRHGTWGIRLAQNASIPLPLDAESREEVVMRQAVRLLDQEIVRQESALEALKSAREALASLDVEEEKADEDDDQEDDEERKPAPPARKLALVKAPPAPSSAAQAWTKKAGGRCEADGKHGGPTMTHTCTCGHKIARCHEHSGKQLGGALGAHVRHAHASAKAKPAKAKAPAPEGD